MANFISRMMRGGGRDQASATTQKNRTLQNLRLALVTATGKTMETLLPLSNARDDNGWKILTIPVAAIPGIKSDDAQIKEMRIFGDTPATLFLGSIGVVVDATPITVQPIDEKVVPRNEK